MKILGIETSCDETAVAVVEDGKEVLASSLATSQALHVKTGGIIPEEAARKQIESVIPVLDDVLKVVSEKEIDKIAVTYGPGLIGSLLVGVETAKTLAYLWNKPLVPVNHLVAHIYANWIGTDKEPEFPLVALVVSGGHTDFVLMKSHPSASSGQVEWIGGTRDDAAGECFDKAARIIGLGYPGGPAISEASKKILDKKVDLDLFPRPMINSQDLDVSFSGLKTAVLNEVKEMDPTSLKLRRGEFAAQIQEAIVESLASKSLKAVEIHNPKSFVLAGGVSANYRLRETLRQTFAKDAPQVKLFLPETKYSTDNAVMIAAAAYYIGTEVNWEDVSANPSLAIEA